MSVVADASAIVDLLRGDLSQAGLTALEGDIVAPDLLLIEVTATVSRWRRQGLVTGVDAQLLVDTLMALPIETLPVRQLLPRLLELSDRLSVYDACYVALAESEDAVVVTTDHRLADAHNLPIRIVAV